MLVVERKTRRQKLANIGFLFFSQVILDIPVIFEYWVLFTGSVRTPAIPSSLSTHIEIGGNVQVKRITKDGNKLIYFRVIIIYAIATTIIEVAVNTQTGAWFL